MDYITQIQEFTASIPKPEPISKVFALAIVLLVGLKIIGWVNGVKGKRTWDARNGGPLTVFRNEGLETGKVRFTRGTIGAANRDSYHRRAGTVTFFEPSPKLGLFRRVLKFLRLFRQRPALRYECIIQVPAVGADPGKLYVDPTVYSHLEKTGNGPHWNVVLKRGNSLAFLLMHPDPNIKTTAWVVLVSSSFEIVRLLLFEVLK
jgi:hypothetical protein